MMFFAVALTADDTPYVMGKFSSRDAADECCKKWEEKTNYELGPAFSFDEEEWAEYIGYQNEREKTHDHYTEWSEYK